MIRSILFSFLLLLSVDLWCSQYQSSNTNTTSLVILFDNKTKELTRSLSKLSLYDTEKQPEEIEKTITEIHDNTIKARDFINNVSSMLQQYDSLTDDNAKALIYGDIQTIHSGVQQYLTIVQPYMFLLNDPQYGNVREKLFKLNRCIMSCCIARIELERRIQRTHSIVEMNTD